MVGRGGIYGDMHGDGQPVAAHAFDLPHLEKLKREKLVDILRRVVANPGNVKEVADELALDWYPMCAVDEKGAVSFVLGGGRKK